MLFGLNDKCYRSYNDDDVKVTETQKANKGEKNIMSGKKSASYGSAQ